MKCIICHGEQVFPGEVSEQVPIGADIVRVPVTVMAYRACGERYYDRATTRYIERVREDIAKDRARLQVVGKDLQVT